MAQIYPPSANPISKLSLAGLLILLPLGFWGLYVFFAKATYVTKMGVTANQPVPFSHQHHVTELEIDCRYCHASVEKSSYAGYPATGTCMTCHSQVFADNPVLKPVRDSFASGRPLRWQSIYKLPDHAYFDHSIHLARGVGCSTCHGAVEQMHQLWKVRPFFMKECLACHRAPTRFLRKREDLYNPDWEPATETQETGSGRQNKETQADCYRCHR